MLSVNGSIAELMSDMEKFVHNDNLMRVREKDNFLQWFKYLLTGVIETAKIRIDTFDKILQLQKKLDKNPNTRSQGQHCAVYYSLSITATYR